MCWLGRTIAATLFLALALNGAATARAEAASPEAVAAANEVLAATGAASRFDSLLPLIMTRVRQGFVKRHPELEKPLEEVFAEVAGRMSARKAEVVEQIAQLYARNFSVEELKAVTAFYRSEVGRKFVTKVPTLMQKVMQIGQTWGRTMAQEMDAEVRRQMQQRGHKL